MYQDGSSAVVLSSAVFVQSEVDLAKLRGALSIPLELGHGEKPRCNASPLPMRCDVGTSVNRSSPSLAAGTSLFLDDATTLYSPLCPADTHHHRRRQLPKLVSFDMFEANG